MDLKELRIGNLLMCGKIITEVSSVDRVRNEFWVIDEDVFLYNSNQCNIKPIEINEDWLIKLGYKYFNGKSEGTLTMDFEGKLDIDYHEGEIKVKSHYEGEFLYRKLYNIKYVHQLQNLYFILSGEELSII